MQQMLAVTQRSGDAKTENILGRITVIGYPRTFLQGKDTFQMETYKRLIVFKAGFYACLASTLVKCEGRTLNNSILIKSLLKSYKKLVQKRHRPKGLAQ